MSVATQSAQIATPRRGWILYDAECGFCQRSIRLWQTAVERQGFQVKSLQSAQAEGLLHVPQENTLDDIRVLTPAGKLVSGADAYLHIARQIWWGRPFYALFSLPGLHWLLDRTYGWINRNRYRISSTCPVTPPARK